MFAEDMGGRVGFPPGALQAELERQSRDQFLEPGGDEVWRRLTRIFRTMDTGGQLGAANIHRFNGGLFAEDAAIDALQLPNRLFVRFGQGRSAANVAEHKQTLYYLATNYNFAREGDAKNSIGLYTLGHIFEQSIVELEKLEADAEQRPSLTDITKRKRDGVYYTPEWVVRRIIEETIDPLFARWKTQAGWIEGAEPGTQAAAAYWERLRRIRIIDPACGSGAFLIVALRHLEKEFAAVADAALRSGALAAAIDEAKITEMILADNLFGVDINPSSVEIAKLSLWLHTAMPNKPLSGLDETIRCGNSLVDKRFYNKRNILDAEERDRINTFEWEDMFSPGSFDAVVGNPQYVKLQNFRKVHADMADWLVSGSSGEAPYQATRTGNFDLYLPFIEKGLSLLNGGGRMGYIAPNLWPTLE
jgi:type I restriction-modification system DNA methylase subunit